MALVSSSKTLKLSSGYLVTFFVAFIDSAGAEIDLTVELGFSNETYEIPIE